MKTKIESWATKTISISLIIDKPQQDTFPINIFQKKFKPRNKSSMFCCFYKYPNQNWNISVLNLFDNKRTIRIENLITPLLKWKLQCDVRAKHSLSRSMNNENFLSANASPLHANSIFLTIALTNKQVSYLNTDH